MPGTDLSPVLNDPQNASDQDHVLFHQDWEVQLTVGKKPGEEGSFKNPAHIRCIRDDEWKYSYYFKPNSDAVEHELYNMKNDPLEMDNLANDSGYQAKRKELFDRMMERENKLDQEFEV